MKLQCYIQEQSADFNRAFLHLEEVNAYSWHDGFKTLDDYELVQFIDQHFHPTYLRVVEAVYGTILRLIAHFSRLDRGKKPESLDIYNSVQEVTNGDLAEITQPYRHTVRNGIAHGGITYLQREMEYRDKKGNTERHTEHDIVLNFDTLLDTVNGLTLALSVFLLSHLQDGYALIREIFIAELREEVRLPWWEIIGCIPTEFPEAKQLIIYARPRTHDYNKVVYSVLQTGLLAERYAPGFDRYLFSIQPCKGLQGWAILDGKRLQELRENGSSTMADYASAIIQNLVFYVPPYKLPSLYHRIETLRAAVQISRPRMAEEFRLKLDLPKIATRKAEIHRNGWRTVLNASVVVTHHVGEIDQQIIKKYCGRIVRKALASARHNSSWTKLDRYLPLGFARISVFRMDYRIRRLASFGLERDLVCTIQFQTIRRIRSPDIWNSTVEQYGKYRIAWNHAWLSFTGSQQAVSPP